MLPNHRLHHFSASGCSFPLFCLPGNQPTNQPTNQPNITGWQRKTETCWWEEKWESYICGVIGPSTCGDHNVLGSQGRLYERREMWGNSFCSYPSKNKEVSNESEWSPQYSAFKWWWKHFEITETSNNTLSVNGGVESTFYLFFIAFMQQASK